jgi:hypothetical protein
VVPATIDLVYRSFIDRLLGLILERKTEEWMDFELTDRCKELQERVEAFMVERVYPAEAILARTGPARSTDGPSRGPSCGRSKRPWRRNRETRDNVWS